MDDKNSIDEVVEEAGETIDNSVEESKALATQETKIKTKKHHEAKKLVEEAKSIVKDSESELQDCQLLLEGDIKVYADALKSLKEGGLDEAKTLLSNLQDLEVSNEEILEDTRVFEIKDEVNPLNLKDVHSGKFTGFLFSLLGGGATFMGLVYLATEKLGITLDITKIPSNETTQTIFGWFGTQVGSSDNAVIGGIIVGAIVLAVMALIYVIRVFLKGNSNLHFAENQMKETQKYITQKSNCKAEMDRVDIHINDAVKVLKDYEILLNEQRGKLKRIFHFEDAKSKTLDFEDKSISTIKETEGLIEQVQTFIATPMSDEGKLSEENIKALKSAKEYVLQLLKVWK